MQRATEWRGVVVCSHNEAGPRATRALTMYRALARLAQHLPEHHAGGVGEHLQLHAGAVRAQIPRSLRHAAARLCSATEGGACVPASTQGPGGAEGDRTAQWLRRSEPSQSRVSAAHESHAGRKSQAKLREFGPSVMGQAGLRPAHRDLCNLSRKQQRLAVRCRERLSCRSSPLSGNRG